MDKVIKQIKLNVVLILLSCLVIFIARSIALGKIATLYECVGADIVFTMITSLVTTGTWRIVEDIKGDLLYDAFLLIIIIVFSIIYGAAITSSNNDAVFTLILSCAVLFVAIYIIENMIIIKHFKKMQICTTDYRYNKEN